jgi:hypothetical protein
MEDIQHQYGSLPAILNVQTLTMQIPHATIIKGNHLEGFNFFRRRLLGSSKAA